MNSRRRPSPQAGLLTPLGPAGITVLQVAGAGAIECVGQILRDAKDHEINLTGKANRIIRGCIVDPNDQQRIDEVLVHYQKMAETNGELVEVCCHGGVRVGQRIMEALAEAGAELVEANDLPSKGFAGLVDKSVDGVAAEVLEHVCGAGTELVVRVLLEQLEGGLRAELDRLLNEDMSIEELAGAIEGLLETWRWGKRLTRPATVAVIGATNAGKSSLANLLSGQDGSIVTSEPGTTRDWVSHHVSLNGLPIVLIDTAGHREAADALEAEAIGRAVEQSRHADVQLVVIDGTGEQVRLPEAAKQTPVVVAVNKADLADWRADAVPAELADWACIKTSAVTGAGREELTEALLKALGCEDTSTTGPAVFTERQENYLRRAGDILGDNNRIERDRLAAAKDLLRECLHGRAEN